MKLAAVARTGLLLARRGAWHAGRPRRGLALPVATALMAVAFTSAFTLLFESQAAAQAPLAWSARVVEWAFTLAVLMLVVSDLHVAVESAVAAPDLALLRAAPLSPRALIALKLTATLPRTLPPVLGIALPALLAYNAVHGGVGAPELALALFVTWAVPLGLGTAAALPLLSAAPAARVRESVAVLATIAFVAGWLLNVFWMPRLVDGTGELAGGLHSLPGAPAWSPATWAARLAIRPDPGLWLACVLAVAAALWLAAQAAARLLGRAQARAATAPARTVRTRARRERTLALAFLRRDAALVSRDWPVALDALANLSLWSLLPLAMLPLVNLPALELARDMLVALSVSLGNDVAARAIPLERAALAWARLSPVGGARWVRMRALGVGLLGLVLVLAAAALVCVALGLSGAAAFDALAFGMCSASGALATGLLLGAWLGETAWTDPRAMLGAGGRAIAAGALLAQATAWWWLSHALSAGTPLAPLMLLVLLIAGAALAAALLWLTARVLERREFTAH